MSQCVPNLNLHDLPPSASLIPGLPDTTPPNLCLLEDYEVAELTWENGQLSMHGLGPPRITSCKPPFSSISKQTTTTSTTTLDEKQLRAGGTLESIVNQAAHLHPTIKTPLQCGLHGTNIPSWFDSGHHHQQTTTTATTLDAMVPSSNRMCSNDMEYNSTLQVPRLDTLLGGGGCSATRVRKDKEKEKEKEKKKEKGKEVINNFARKRRSTSVAQVPVLPHEGSSSSRNQSLTGSANSSCRKESWHVTLDTCDDTYSASFGSLPENSNSGKPSPSSYSNPVNIDDPDSDSQSKLPQQREEAGGTEQGKKKGQSGKSSVSTRRSRAAAIHNQSERKRRDKINQRMKTLQKLVPNSSKTDKASMLDEVIEYIKQMQAQVQMVNRMSMTAAAAPHMMMPPAVTTMQQQLRQLFFMSQMGMGSGVGMAGMLAADLSHPMLSIGHHHHRNITGIPSFLHPTTAVVMAADPLSTFLACQSQNMSTMDSYNQMAAMYQQLNQTQTQVAPNSKTY